MRIFHISKVRYQESGVRCQEKSLAMELGLEIMEGTNNEQQITMHKPQCTTNEYTLQHFARNLVLTSIGQKTVGGAWYVHLFDS